MEKNKMENYKIKVQITSLSDDVIGEFEVTTKECNIVKETTGKDLINQGIELVLDDIKETRISNPHHHMNRID